MRLLLYSPNYHPEFTGIGKFNWEMSCWLAERGHEVTVLCAYPYYPEWKLRTGFPSWRYSREVHSNVKVHRSPIWVPKRVTAVTRILHLTSFAFSSLLSLLFLMNCKPDVVIVVQPPILCAPAALLFCSLTKARSCMHVQDLEIDAALGLGLIKEGRLSKGITFLERVVLEKFDLLLTISKSMRLKIEERANLKSSAYLFKNWADVDRIHPRVDGAHFRKELDLSVEDTVVLYSGNLGFKQGLDIVIDCARYLEGEKRIQFVICGAGAAENELRKRAKDLVNMHWLPLQPEKMLPNLLACPDIHVLPQRLEADQLVLPSKLGGILSSGRPVVVTAMPGSELGDAVGGGGILVPPQDAGALANAIQSLHKDPVFRAKLGRTARETALRDWNKEVILADFEDHLLSTIG